MHCSIVIWTIVFQLISIAKDVQCESYTLKLTSTAPAIDGVNVTFIADVYTSNGHVPHFTDKLDWYWQIDNDESNKFETKIPHAAWNYTFPQLKYDKKYHLKVSVSRVIYYFDYPIAEANLDVDITTTLNGQLMLVQNGTERTTNYISSADPLNQAIEINAYDLARIKNASYVSVYWFLDCQYIGQSDEWNATNFFKKENATYNLEALLVASFEPRPQPITTTTTTTKPSTTTTTTKTTSTTTATTTTTTKKPTNRDRRKREFDAEEHAKHMLELLSATNEIDKKFIITENKIIPPKPNPISKTTISPLHDRNLINQPYVCFNKSNVPPDPKKIYGYFSREVTVRNPLTNLAVGGALWIKFEDGIHLNVTCSGSPPFNYCIEDIDGPKNTTGNETCTFWRTSNICEFPFTRYLFDDSSHTILIIVQNEVTTLRKIVTVNCYEVKKQSQLSVIVIPMIFIICSVVAIIFGVAKYVQTRNRLSVEVADFNFGETTSVSDLDYKSFHRRLYDSIREILPRRGYTTTDDVDDSARYGTMT